MKLNREKINRALRGKIVSFCRNKKYYYCLYKSYRHYVMSKKNNSNDKTELYFSAVPNRGAGIGHQMANWIAGYWFSKQFNLKFAHIPFAQKSWEDFLGFGENEVLVSDLKKAGYKIVRLPLFDEQNKNEVELIKQIIQSYCGTKTVFVCEQDQFYHDQFGVCEDIQRKFYSADARKMDKIVFDKDKTNIAVHVRRGDINVAKREENKNLSMRWQDNDYFVNVLKNSLKLVDEKKPYEIYIFSQGKKEDYLEFEQFDNVHFCFDMSAQQSFLHMVNADILITSKSSFSYKPALLNKGIKVCPNDFWHGYPDDVKWIIADEKGILIV